METQQRATLHIVFDGEDISFLTKYWDLYAIDEYGLDDHNDIVIKAIEDEFYAKNIHPARGDVIRPKFATTRQLGFYFYDGEKIILPETDGDRDAVPSTFKVPYEFPITYWDDTGFMGYRPDELTYDIARASIIEVPGGCEYYGCKLYQDTNKGGSKILIACDSTESNVAGRLDKLYAKFLTNGRCMVLDFSIHDASQLAPYVDDKTVIVCE